LVVVVALLSCQYRSHFQRNQEGTVHIRTEQPGDAEAIHTLTVAAFQTVPYGDGSEGRIIDSLRASGALALSLVAKEAGVILGQVTFSPVTIDGREGPWLGLGPIAVAPARKHQGIGSALIREGLARIAAEGAELCVLLGNPAYYGRFGFEHDPALSCDDGPAEAFQRIVLKGEAPRGKVTFHNAFGVG
jgi:putative acetyltransferase